MVSETVDQLDRQLLQALQLDGRAPFSKIAEVLGVSDQTVARRYAKLCAHGGLRVLGLADEARLGRTNWILRLSCTPDAAEPLATALARRPDTRWIGLISGGTEVLCVMAARTTEDRDTLLLDKIQRTPRVTAVRAHCVLHTFYGGTLGWYTKSDALDPAQVAALTPPPPEPVGEPVELDPADEALFAALFQDGRAPVTELAQATRVSESAVRRRLDRLRSTGALVIDVQFDSVFVGYDTKASLWLTVTPAALGDVGTALAAHREVAFAAAVSGPANVVATVLCRDTHALYRYLSDRIGPLDGVQHVETAPLLRQVKRLTYENRRGGGVNAPW
ncbi:MULTISPECIES: Lrp/AsnC family transcriptional regulator [Streptomycetaceae]|uniref:Transcriptional regulatory protein n=1 Tax=Streptantibioticus cattleyicolor (strain ATCC 35852 / DSM 46488 / JCM 4925 / NBRC 14057 / NRRL 8057) TaxID=1003195 RepID=F8JZH7_STREN|nr:Lrp/AsnC family transcriptional regulator [Streptantibioticus cattleyicolor]AEW97277.1 transcriptional regulatory protein [Streptantibioticus cattleyicolor NRRL 8057 = DSM 46488]MYS61731.1 AsnC family transcriptional regulator [Streptomyces sp. SID5468]CCB77599.1 putative AsnC-family transcriptional regulator [Streptantibioticus cattleyicolor NRRL 8057 = DSM 46488]